MKKTTILDNRNPTYTVNKTLEAFAVTMTCPHTGHLYRPTVYLTLAMIREGSEWFVLRITDAGRLVFSFDEGEGFNSPLVRAICEEKGWSQCSRMGSISIDEDVDEDDCDDILDGCDEDEDEDDCDDILDGCDEDEDE